MNNITDYHARYFAHELTRRCSSDSLEKLTSTLTNAQVDLNPHQIEAALFAFKSPLSKGAILADEVGLGKTIEAGLVLAQKWAERKRKILLIVPSSLRKQWSTELQEKFFLPSLILEAKSFNQQINDGNLNPFNQTSVIIICSYHFAKAKSAYIKQSAFDLVVIDEAHRLRNVYKPANRIANEIKNAVQQYHKLLLTATPLQNSLLELYGLTSIIDDNVFGDLNSFKANYARVSYDQGIYDDCSDDYRQEMFSDLRDRLKKVCIRTLRRQVQQYINYRERKPITQDYIPTAEEIELYDGMTEYLQRQKLYALPCSQRQLMTLILRKLLASSTFAIASTLETLINRLTDLEKDILEKANQSADDLLSELARNYENTTETAEEWLDDDENEDDSDDKTIKYKLEDIPAIQTEKNDLIRFQQLAKNIFKNSKGESLLIALQKGFEMAAELGASRKAVIFTESVITQNYLEKLLTANGYQDKIVLFNGSNNDKKSKEIYKNWFDKYKNSDKITGSKTADLRAALTDYFKSDAEIMIATEAAAEGINLQFCSIVINYDLPWNPQRIEQRIGRCHRYGQKHDVVVINFVNRKNAADQRVYELLDQKFKLFKGVFGASDEVLGVIESGMDFEKRIAAIYQSCRKEEEINAAFDALQKEMEESVKAGVRSAKEKLLENFDTDVHEKLRINLKESRENLEAYEKWLWEITSFYLQNRAEYDSREYSFLLKENPFPEENIPAGPYKIGKNIDNAHIYRPGHPLAEKILEQIKSENLPEAELIFDYSGFGLIISPVKELVGQQGVLQLSLLTVSALEEEDYLIFTALTTAGQELDEEIVRKLFKLKARVTNEGVTLDNTALLALETAKVQQLCQTVASRNADFFDEEVEKLDKWAEDVKKSLEIELKKLDVEIKTLKTEAKKVLQLEQKVKLQRQIKDKEKKRNEMRQKLYQAQDEVDTQKDGLLERVEAQLNQQTELKKIFTVKFRVI